MLPSVCLTAGILGKPIPVVISFVALVKTEPEATSSILILKPSTATEALGIAPTEASTV